MPASGTVVGNECLRAPKICCMVPVSRGFPAVPEVGVSLHGAWFTLSLLHWCTGATALRTGGCWKVTGGGGMDPWGVPVDIGCPVDVGWQWMIDGGGYQLDGSGEGGSWWWGIVVGGCR